MSARAVRLAGLGGRTKRERIKWTKALVVSSLRRKYGDEFAAPPLPCRGEAISAGESFPMASFGHVDGTLRRIGCAVHRREHATVRGAHNFFTLAMNAGALDASNSVEAERLRAIAEAQPAFSKLMDMRITSFSRDRVEAEMMVRQEFANRNGVLHGGALMAFADNIGGTASFLNLAPGATTATVESKTNFFRPISVGETARAVCIPLHRGRTTMVWQTTIRGDNGKPAAIVTQTQLVIRSTEP
jgi:uncharacterized protein (TIGR00369 family)